MISTESSSTSSINAMSSVASMTSVGFMNSAYMRISVMPNNVSKLADNF